MKKVKSGSKLATTNTLLNYPGVNKPGTNDEMYDTQKYKKDNINFEVLDATKDSLPYADLIICKDLFLHLSLDNISLILKNIIDSKCKYFATSRYEGGSKGNNSNSSAQARPIEVTKDPFNFDYPIVSQFRYTIKSNLRDEIIIFKIN